MTCLDKKIGVIAMRAGLWALGWLLAGGWTSCHAPTRSLHDPLDQTLLRVEFDGRLPAVGNKEGVLARQEVLWLFQKGEYRLAEQVLEGGEQTLLPTDNPLLYWERGRYWADTIGDNPRQWEVTFERLAGGFFSFQQGEQLALGPELYSLPLALGEEYVQLGRLVYQRLPLEEEGAEE